MIFQKYLYICSTRMKMYGTVTMHLEYPTYIKASELMFFLHPARGLLSFLTDKILVSLKS